MTDRDMGDTVDAGSMEQFDRQTVGYFLIVINAACLLLIMISLWASVAPLVKGYCCSKITKNNASTKVNPEHGGGDAGSNGSGTEVSNEQINTDSLNNKVDQPDQGKPDLKDGMSDNEKLKHWM